MNLNFIYKSYDHIRYENGEYVKGPHGGARRIITVEENLNGCEGYNIKKGDGYIVTLYNVDGENPGWRNNIQMKPKPMRIVSQTPNKIMLRGYQTEVLAPTGWIDFNGADYGLTILMEDGQINECILHVYHQKVDIKYLKDENLVLQSEPEILSLAKKANSSYQNGDEFDGQNLLNKIYRLIKDKPSQLKDLNEYSALATSFLIMLSHNLTDDVDKLQVMASVGYFCIGKAINNDEDNPNLYKDRLLILRSGQEAFSYTVMAALGLTNDLFATTSPRILSRDAIYKMEIADLETFPILYQQIELFRNRKIEFDEMIRNNHFNPQNNLNSIVKTGIENHLRVFNYIERIMIDNDSVDF
jgi:hypothetical protein